MAPSPKVHSQLVGEPPERSEKLTVSGATPESGVLPKSATGAGGALTLT